MSQAKVAEQIEAAMAGIAALRAGGAPGHAVTMTGGFRYDCECGEKCEGIAAYGAHGAHVLSVERRNTIQTAIQRNRWLRDTLR